MEEVPGVLKSLTELNNVKPDIWFLVGPNKERVGAHKLILASRSEAFRKMVYTGDQLSDLARNEFTITDASISSNDFRSFLQFVYTGVTNVTSTNLLSLLQLSLEYCVTELTVICQNFVTEMNANDSLLVSIGALSAGESGEMVFPDAFKRLCLFSRQIIRDDRWPTIPKQLLIKILESSEFEVPEVDLFLALTLWYNVNRSGDVFSKIRYGCISRTDLIQKVKPTGLADTEKFLSALDYHSNPLCASQFPRTFYTPRRNREQMSREERIQDCQEQCRIGFESENFEGLEEAVMEMGEDLNHSGEWLKYAFKYCRGLSLTQDPVASLLLTRKILSLTLKHKISHQNLERTVYLLYLLLKVSGDESLPLEGIEEGKLVLSRLQELIDGSLNALVLDVILDYYVISVALVMNRLRDLALWSELHRIGEEAMKKGASLRPLLFDRVVELEAASYHQQGRTRDAIQKVVGYYSIISLLFDRVVELEAASYHQQGRTRDAIQKVVGYYSIISHLSDDKIFQQIPWCLSRTSKFHFYLDQFEESRQFLTELSRFKKIHGLAVTAQELGDLLIVYSELDLKEEFTKMLTQIRERDAAESCTIRSKYLLTTKINVTHNNYTVSLLVCRTLPSRREGNIDEESQYVRKLDSFYAQIVYEFPTKNKEVVVEEKKIEGYFFDLVSPTFVFNGEEGWYLFTIYIYKDETKLEMLGKHYQPIFCQRTQQTA
eukprot:TRINITY_DN6574_c0_g1_i1.p1 TRINITY_DN6574_c0_g1~~TRINITY_DN6574_c0_g1_i1.p1  ORF type:complete len:718 (-),score=123.93 TRINITY_DN6574_c0_g1_i1:89-2242(-)